MTDFNESSRLLPLSQDLNMAPIYPCDESRPQCAYCKTHNLHCTYNVDVAASPGSQSSDDSPVAEKTSTSSPFVLAKRSNFISSPQSAVNLFPDWEAHDRGLLQHYLTSTGRSLTLIRRKGVDRVVEIEFPRLAIEFDFMRHCLLGIAALHLQHLAPNVTKYQSLALSHRVRALSSLRTAISRPSKESSRAVLAASLLIVIASSGSAATEIGDDLWIGDWLGLWAGMRQMIDLLSWEFVQQSGLAPIFAKDDFPKRPLIFLPSVLSDKQFLMGLNAEDTIVILDTLGCLSKLYEHLLGKGLTQEFSTQIIAWPPNTYIAEYSAMVKQRQPQALVIAAYYLVFNTLIDEAWWLGAISIREIKSIAKVLPLAFQSYMIIPLQAVGLGSKWDVAALLLSQLSEVSSYDDFNNAAMSLRQKTTDRQPVEEIE